MQILSQMDSVDEIKSVFQMLEIAQQVLPIDVFEYLQGGADDEITIHRNREAFQSLQLRPRRLVDVSTVDTSIELLNEHWDFPFALAPVGLQAYFNEGGEIATGKAAQSTGCQMVVSTVSNFSYSEVARQFKRKPWFQLYPTTTRSITESLILKAQSNGCKVLVLTVDVPVLGNRQKHRKHLVEATEGGTMQLGNFPGARGSEAFNDPSMTWDIIPWIREICDMKIVLKGIMTAEDAVLSIENKVDGIIVSNHGGRQLESNLSTIEVLDEVCGAVKNKIPVMLDGGIRRGTDILKAIALGANAVFLGRAFCYGLGAFGEKGVQKIIQLLQEEITRDMQLLGVTKIKDLNQSYIRSPKF